MIDVSKRPGDLPIIVALAAVLMMLSGCQGIARSIADQNLKPNIIYIMADDLGYADLGCYGQKNIQTPQLDRMSAEGMRFTQHYAGNTVCAPSRCSLMTGLHPGHAYVRGNRWLKPEGQLPIPNEAVTVAEVLKQAGYVTGVTGKWALGGPGTSGVPNKQGFDDWFGYLCQRQAHTYYPEHLWHNGQKVILEGNADGKGQQYTHDMFTDFALKFIRKNKGQRFFLYVPYCIPHGKYEVPSIEPYADKPWSQEEKTMAAMVTRMDKDVGRILDLLKELDIDEKTLVFFTSDNGAAYRFEGVFNSCGPLKGRKRDTYEGGIRTPMIAWWPGTIKPGSLSDHISAFWDLLPTCAELAGADTPENVDGLSMAPTLLGQPGKQKQHEYLYWEFHWHSQPKQALRMGDFKAVRLSPKKPLELYNLKTDLGENINLADKHPDIVKKMEEYMKAAHTPSPNWRPL